MGKRKGRKGKEKKTEEEKRRYREHIPENRASERGDIFLKMKKEKEGRGWRAEENRRGKKKKGDPVLYSLAFLRVSENEWLGCR